MLGNEDIKTWDQFKALEIQNQVSAINNLLLEGYSIPRISETIEGEKEGQGIDRTIIAKHFKRNQYRRDTDENKLFIYDETIVATSSYKPKPILTQEKQIQKKHMEQFTQEEVEILKRVISEYKLRDFVMSDTSEEEKGESANRNIRVYTKQYQAFAEFCKANHLKQSDALYNAISVFMKRI